MGFGLNKRKGIANAVKCLDKGPFLATFKSEGGLTKAITQNIGSGEGV